MSKEPCANKCRAEKRKEGGAGVLSSAGEDGCEAHKLVLASAVALVRLPRPHAGTQKHPHKIAVAVVGILWGGGGIPRFCRRLLRHEEIARAEHGLARGVDLWDGCAPSGSGRWRRHQGVAVHRVTPRRAARRGAGRREGGGGCGSGAQALVEHEARRPGAHSAWCRRGRLALSPKTTSTDVIWDRTENKKASCRHR